MERIRDALRKEEPEKVVQRKAESERPVTPMEWNKTLMDQPVAEESGRRNPSNKQLRYEEDLWKAENA